ncbi:MAG TPA: bifunctional riboflavin kinase/FAD synthetase [Pirellulales bacterium]|nr:bifunctional riboflavin kinase/FAD synthetase [Pirellulales bacterium]
MSQIIAMRLIRDLARLPTDLCGGAVAIGNFDGVHLGHARIAKRLIERAREVGGPAVVFTFDPHPVRILRPQEAPPPLTWTDRKAELLGELGVDAMIAYPTDEELLRLTPEEFFDGIVRDRLGARALVEGPNFNFGRGRSGTIDVLRKLCQKAGIELEVVEPVVVDGDYVSSSRVRKLISEGQIDLARRMLTCPYRLRGMVRHGAARGAKLGFPTANLDAIDTLLPGPGVYAGAGIASGGRWPAAISVGPNPTFGEQRMKVEVHLIGFSDSLYGQPLEVDFAARLRDIQRFDSVAALKAQLERDVAAAARLGSEK